MDNRSNPVEEGLFEGMCRASRISLDVDFMGLYSLRISGHDIKNHINLLNIIEFYRISVL